MAERAIRKAGSRPVCAKAVSMDQRALSTPVAVIRAKTTALV